MKNIPPKILLVAVIVSWGLMGCQPLTKNQSDQTAPSVADQLSTPTTQIIQVAATQSGQTALDLTKSKYTVTVQDSNFGSYVTAIDGVAADDAHYWALYINGQYADRGADVLITQAGDLIEWHLEQLVNNSGQ